MDEAAEAVPPTIARLWEYLRKALRDCDDPSPRDIDRIAASCGLRLPSSTVEGWFKTWSVVPAWEKFEILVKALGAEQDRDWKALHAAALQADRRRKAKVRRLGANSPPAPTAPDADTQVRTTTAADPPNAGPPDSTVAAAPHHGRLHITAEVTRLPMITAELNHKVDKRSVLFVSLAVLLVLVTMAIFLSALAAEPSDVQAPRSLAVQVQSPASSPKSARGPSDGWYLPEWPLPTISQLRSETPAKAGAAVLYVGDTLAVENRNVVAYFVHRTGRARVVAAAYPDVAICDFLAGRNASAVPPKSKLAALVKAVKPRVVALQFWGFSSARTPCTGNAHPTSDAYHHRYQADARQAAQEVTQAAREAGIVPPRLIWVLQGPDRDMPDRVRRLNEQTYATVATMYGDLVADAGWFVSQAAYPYAPATADDRYTWKQFLNCTAVEVRYGYCTRLVFGGIAQFYNDGGEAVRFCLSSPPESPRPCRTKSPGLTRYSQAIAYGIIRAVG